MRAVHNSLTGRPLEESRSVRVENVPENICEMHLKAFFEDPKQGGGRVKDIVMLPEERAALITFQETAGEFTEWVQRRPSYVGNDCWLMMLMKTFNCLELFQAAHQGDIEPLVVNIKVFKQCSSLIMSEPGQGIGYEQSLFYSNINFFYQSYDLLCDINC